jgi:hypothetical protein
MSDLVISLVSASDQPIDQQLDHPLTRSSDQPIDHQITTSSAQ